MLTIQSGIKEAIRKQIVISLKWEMVLERWTDNLRRKALY
jgi:hypothetical protein